MCTALHFALVPHACAVKDTLFNCPVKTVKSKSPYALNCLFKVSGIGISRSEYIIHFFVYHFSVSRHCSVNECLELSVHGVEINRRCKNDNVSVHHFVHYLRHIVFLHALVSAVANAAACAVENRSYHSELHAGKTHSVLHLCTCRSLSSFFFGKNYGTDNCVRTNE